MRPFSMRGSSAFVAVWLFILATYGGLHAQAPAPPAPLPTPPPAMSAPPGGFVSSISPGYVQPATVATGTALGFRYDTVFHLGAYYNGIHAASYIKDTLHCDFTLFYHGPMSMKYIRDTAYWGSPGTKDWSNAEDKLAFYGDLLAHDLKMVYAPGDLAALQVSTTENYLGVNGDYVHAASFAKRTPLYTNTPKDTFFYHGYWDATYPDSSGEFLIAGLPSFTSLGIYPDDTSMHSRLWKNAVGEHYDDSSLVYDLTVRFKGSISPALDTGTALVKLIIYHRDTIGQHACRCSFYTPYDTIPVSIGEYFGNNRSIYVDSTVGNDYREITHTFTLPASKTYHAGKTLTIQGHWIDTNLQTVVGLGHRDSTTSVRIYLTVYGSHIDTNEIHRDTIVGTDNHDTTITQTIVHDTTTRTLFVNGATIHSYVPSVGWYDWPTSPTRAYCRALYDSLKHWGVVDTNIVNEGYVAEGSDIVYDIKSTGVVPITFLQARVSPHRFTQLQRGAFDSLIYRSIDTMYNDVVAGQVDTTIRHLLKWVGLMDEVQFGQYESWRILSSKVQRRMYQTHHDTASGRKIFANPYGDHASLRIRSGDLDSTDVRMLHMIVSQPYVLTGKIPVRYAYPDLMDSMALATYFKPSENIAFNTGTSYQSYLAQSQKDLDKKIGDMVNVTDVARRRFAPFTSNTFPVYGTVQVMGFLANNNGVYLNKWGFRPPTPEEITAESWLTLNCGMDGMSFSDFTFDGTEYGVMPRYQNPITDTSDTMEYRAINDGGTYPSPTLPKMWVGFGTRYNAVKRITDAFKGPDSILAYYSRLDFHNGLRISVAKDGAYFPPTSVIDTIYTQRPKRFKDGGGHYQDSIVDPKNQTHLEVTLFNPGPSDPYRKAQYIIITNRRCWPIDERTYGAVTNELSDTYAGGHDTKGYGPIDVRRPVIKLRTIDEMLGGAYRIRRIGSESAWRTVQSGDTVQLDWLDPGWGAMYQIVPVGVSQLGLAYNNGVHAENLSIDTVDTVGADHLVKVEKTKLVVYERDSTVYLRILDSAEKWSGEIMISDAADTAKVTGTTAVKRYANNMVPTIAAIRDSGGGTLPVMVVWERDSAGKVTTEARYFPNPGCDISQSKRLRLSAQKTMPGSSRMTPVIAAHVDGWVVAWAAPNDTLNKGFIEAVAVRSPRSSSGPSDTGDVSAVFQVHATGAEIGPGFKLSGVVGFPSLASARYFPEDNLDRAFHLAFRQGGSSGTGVYIFYDRLKARYNVVGKPTLGAVDPVDHVSAGLGTCLFDHPSIAADSMNVYVAFEAKYTVMRKNASFPWQFLPYDPVDFIHSVQASAVLRVRRDTTLPVLPSPWNTPQTYMWRDAAGSHEQPSLTVFPGRFITNPWWLSDEKNIQTQVDGGMSWMRLHGSSSLQLIYRLGNLRIDTLANAGRSPSMMLVPTMRGTPFPSTGVVYRSDDIAHVAAPRPVLGGNAWYYPAYLEYAPILYDSATFNKDSLFFVKPRPATPVVHSMVTVTHIDSMTPCKGEWVNVRLRPDPPMIDRFPVTVDHHGDSLPDPLPLTFFPSNGPTVWPSIDSLNKVDPVMRTAVFNADGTSFDLRRILQADDSLANWLNTAPYDSAMNSPGDIKIITELVKVSGGTVLWRDDTISARDIPSLPPVEVVTIPVGSVTSVGMPVYVRIRLVPTAGLNYEAAAGFEFLDDSATIAEIGPAKRGSDGSGAVLPESGMRMTVIPNPARDEAELRLVVTAPGPIRIALHDMLGRVVKELPGESAAVAGEYVMRLDLAGLPAGTYTVRVGKGDEVVSTRLVIVR